MTYFIDKHVKVKYKDKEVKVPMIILAILGILKARHKQKWDTVILITGKVGSAKTSMAKIIGGLWEVLHERELSIKNFTWASEGVVSFIEAEGNDTEVIIYDEAIKGGTGRDGLTKEGNMLKVGLVVGRRKRHLYIMIVDELAEFNKKIVSRANMLIDMRTLLVKGEETRGFFKIYNEAELKEIYWLMKDNKIRYISQYNGIYKPFYKFKDPTNIFIDEAEYENAKIEQTRQDLGKSDKPWSEAKLRAFYLWSTTKMTNASIADEVKVHSSSLTLWVREFKKIAG